MMLNAIRNKLADIDHFKKYPSMIPFIGDNYISSDHSKLLLIAESYYLPNTETLHHDPQQWYQSNQDDLQDDEWIAWIDCNGLLKCNWDKPGHYIYRELNSSIQSLDFKKKKRPIEEVAYTNFFFRPSESEGESFKKYCTPLDISMSNKIIEKIVQIMNPDLIIFVSKYSWDKGGSELKSKYPEKKISFVCHPTTGGRYWYRKDYPHNKSKFINLLNEHFIF